MTVSNKVELAGVETSGALAERPAVRLLELARVFFVIGLSGFGGGMAIVALIQRECAERRGWIARDEFAHGVAFGQFLGAFAVNTATFVGYRVRGLPGALLAVGAFLAPGVALIIVFSAAYFHFQHVPALKSALAGIGPVVVAVLLVAAYRMGRGVMSSAEPWALLFVAFALVSWVSAPVILVVLGLGAYGVGRHLVLRRGGPA
jgi:chromate transporter